MPNHTSLASLFSDIADAIRAKTGDSGQIVADGFPDEIAAIPTGTVATATTPGTGSSPISFSVLGEPKAFAIIATGTVSTSFYGIYAVVCDGQTVRSQQAGNSSNSVYAENYSYTYANGTLTVTASSSGKWVQANNMQYLLVYIY